MSSSSVSSSSASSSSKTPKSEYAQEQEMRHRRKIVLPVVIPWEYGSNKFASQKGTSGFGAIRNQVVKIESSKKLSDSDDSCVPWINCPAMKEKYASQAGEKPFGGTRNQVTKVKETENDEQKLINEIVVDKKATARVLKKWDQPNPEAKNDHIYGKRRGATTTAVGGRRFTTEEITKSRAAIPKFQNIKDTAAAQNSKPGEAPSTGYRSHRQVTTMINGLDRSLQDQLDTNKYMAWIGGQVTLQSQSFTGGFQKPRDVVSTSYYDRLMNERKADLEAAKLRQRLLEEALKQNGGVNGHLSTEEDSTT
ncbi:hypothetical protein QR680_015446 [Steinernema hermaphroditum]|uniref:Uncharacterized protein n=1 Tax=Steinernema hermaphroditum TaxID=289476 RepID=A0AA39H7P9_9BILA|nr:hypothetical protein QR680_015446 [Steinernema hermaphroditum]